MASGSRGMANFEIMILQTSNFSVIRNKLENAKLYEQLKNEIFRRKGSNSHIWFKTKRKFKYFVVLRMSYYELKSKLVHGALWERFYERDIVYQSNVLNLTGLIETEIVPSQHDRSEVNQT